jgi:hypothetical protein
MLELSFGKREEWPTAGIVDFPTLIRASSRCGRADRKRTKLNTPEALTGSKRRLRRRTRDAKGIADPGFNCSFGDFAFHI